MNDYNDMWEKFREDFERKFADIVTEINSLGENMRVYRFRWQRGGYEESMGTIFPWCTKEDLTTILRANGYEGEVTFVYYGFDERNRWRTYLVSVNGDAVGFTDGDPSMVGVAARIDSGTPYYDLDMGYRQAHNK